MLKFRGCEYIKKKRSMQPLESIESRARILPINSLVNLEKTEAGHRPDAAHGR